MVHYIEHCVQNYLKVKFSNWTFKNDDIINSIQKYQIRAFVTYK